VARVCERPKSKVPKAEDTCQTHETTLKLTEGAGGVGLEAGGLDGVNQSAQQQIWGAAEDHDR
jgi:hypothetical protein